MLNKVFNLLIFYFCFSLSAWAQEGINPKPPMEESETMVVETDVDINDTQATDKAEEELREYFLNQLKSAMLYPELYHLERYTTANQTVGFKAELSWVRKQNEFQDFDHWRFQQEFQKQIALPTEANILFFKVKTTPAGTLPGMKFGNNFSANFYTSPITYNRNGALNHSYMGKQTYYNNAEWFEGSGRLQFFMDLSNYLNMKTKTKIFLTAGVYSSFLDIKEQQGFNGYINNINRESLKFHAPNYNEVNFGIRVRLDGSKKYKRTIPIY